MTLVASPAMVAEIQRLINSKRISRSAYEHARNGGYTDAEIIRQADEQRALKARIAVENAPHLYRPATEVGNVNDPTPQWRMKGGKRITSEVVGKGALVPLRKYRFRSNADQYSDKLGKIKLAAIARYAQDADYHQRVRNANWQASGGGGERIGGLGDVPPHVRAGHDRYVYISRLLSPEAVLAAKALLTQELLKGDGSPFSLEDFGARIDASVQHSHRRWGLSFGQMKLLAAQLVHFYGLIGARPIDDAERDAEYDAEAGDA